MKDRFLSWTNQDMFCGGTLGDESTVHVTLTLCGAGSPYKRGAEQLRRGGKRMVKVTFRRAIEVDPRATNEIVFNGSRSEKSFAGTFRDCGKGAE